MPIQDDMTDGTTAILDLFGNAIHDACGFDLAGKDVMLAGAGTDRYHGRIDRTEGRIQKSGHYVPSASPACGGCSKNESPGCHG